MDIHLVRRANFLLLFRGFIENYIQDYLRENPAAPLSGMDKAFAAHVQIHNTTISSIKSGSRPIGPQLARQIEAAFNKPEGWMDEDHGESPRTEEQELQVFLKLATRAFKRASMEQREVLAGLIRANMPKV